MSQITFMGDLKSLAIPAVQVMISVPRASSRNRCGAARRVGSSRRWTKSASMVMIGPAEEGKHKTLSIILRLLWNL